MLDFVFQATRDRTTTSRVDLDLVVFFYNGT
jgi:hypothetical protein